MQTPRSGQCRRPGAVNADAPERSMQTPRRGRCKRLGAADATHEREQMCSRHFVVDTRGMPTSVQQELARVSMLRLELV
jgi:hypothetical protein